MLLLCDVGVKLLMILCYYLVYGKRRRVGFGNLVGRIGYFVWCYL